jgi:hypothetical protein
MRCLVISSAVVALTLSAGCASSPDPDRPTAADATYGTWQGTMTPRGSETVNISYVIRLQKSKEAGSVVLPASAAGGEGQQLKMSDLSWDGTNLDYAWTTPQGVALNCQLVKQSDTLLSGSCWDSSSVNQMEMTMSPPVGRLDTI